MMNDTDTTIQQRAVYHLRRSLLYTPMTGDELKEVLGIVKHYSKLSYSNYLKTLGTPRGAGPRCAK